MAETTISTIDAPASHRWRLPHDWRSQTGMAIVLIITLIAFRGFLRKEFGAIR